MFYMNEKNIIFRIEKRRMTHRKYWKKKILTQKKTVGIMNVGDSAFLESLVGRMRRGLKAHFR